MPPRAATPQKSQAALLAEEAKAAQRAADLAAQLVEDKEEPVREPWTLAEGESAPDGSPVRLFSPREARGYAGQLYVRNNTETQVCFDNGTGVTNVLKLARAGKYDSVASLPPHVAVHPGFQRFWAMGKVTVTNDPSIELEFEEYAEAAALAERAREQEINAVVYHTQRSIPASFPIPGVTA